MIKSSLLLLSLFVGLNCFAQSRPVVESYFEVFEPQTLLFTQDRIDNLSDFSWIWDAMKESQGPDQRYTYYVVDLKGDTVLVIDESKKGDTTYFSFSIDDSPVQDGYSITKTDSGSNYLGYNYYEGENLSLKARIEFDEFGNCRKVESTEYYDETNFDTQQAEYDQGVLVRAVSQDSYSGTRHTIEQVQESQNGWSFLECWTSHIGEEDEWTDTVQYKINSSGEWIEHPASDSIQREGYTTISGLDSVVTTFYTQFDYANSSSQLDLGAIQIHLDNKLIRSISYSKNGHYKTTDFEYNEQGKLVLKTSYDSRYDTRRIDYQVTTDELDRVTRIKHASYIEYWVYED